MWKMFIDDERFPINNEFVIVRSVEEAKNKINELGMTIYISFGNLGDNTEEDLEELINWFIKQDIEKNNQFIPSKFDFDFQCEKTNKIKKLESFLINYLLKNEFLNKIYVVMHTFIFLMLTYHVLFYI